MQSLGEECSGKRSRRIEEDNGKEKKNEMRGGKIKISFLLFLNYSFH